MLLNLTGFSTRDLRILLSCQEYPEGDFASEIRVLLLERQITA